MPITLTSKFFAGSAIESMTLVSAARCTTVSTLRSERRIRLLVTNVALHELHAIGGDRVPAAQRFIVDHPNRPDQSALRENTHQVRADESAAPGDEDTVQHDGTCRRVFAVVQPAADRAEGRALGPTPVPASSRRCRESSRHRTCERTCEQSP